MEYQEFLYAIESELNEKLKEGTRAVLYSTVKNNGKERKGVMIEQEGSNIGPTIYLEGFYERYKEDPDISRIITELLEFYESVKCTEIIQECQFDDYEVMKEKIVFKVVHYEKNRKMLESVPHIRFLDLAIIFYILLEAGENGMATVLIKNEHLELWKLSMEELHEKAIKNAIKLLPAQFMSMRQAMKEILNEQGKDSDELEEESENEVMYILTNSLKNFGAATLAYPHVLEMIAEMLQEDFYILPSSVHEVIIVPKSKGIDEKEMNTMIIEINATQLEPEDVLSDHAYFYDSREHKLKMNR